MIINIIGWVIIIILYILSFKFFKTQLIDKAQSIYEKITIILVFIILVIPFFLYIVDYYNIPTKFSFTKSVELKRWVDFIFNYTAIIAGSVVSGIILLIITLLQIESQNKSNKEDRRINNLPIIDYDIKLYCDDTTIPKIDLCKENNNQLLEVYIELKNIGMNIVRKSFINIKTDLLNDDYDYELPNRGLIKKDDKNGLIFRMPKDNDEIEIRFIVKYQDILFNWYQQEVLVNMTDIQYMKIIGVSSKINKDIKDEIKLDKDIVLNIKQV